jgi:hypothetical protein
MRSLQWYLFIYLFGRLTYREQMSLCSECVALGVKGGLNTFFETHAHTDTYTLDNPSY